MDFDQIIKIIEIVIEIVGTFLVVLTIFVGFKQIKAMFEQSKLSKRLELAEDMVSEYLSLIECANKSLFYFVAKANNEAKKINSFKDYPRQHREKLQKMKNKILAYGSSTLIQLFDYSYSWSKEMSERGKGDIDSYKQYLYMLPLTAAYIKYDITGETVNPSIVYAYSMDEIRKLEVANGMENYHKEMIELNDNLVHKFNLPNDFLWKESDD